MNITSMTSRSRDDAEVGAFTEEMLVVCPRCGQCARVAPVDAAATSWSAPRRLTCASCGGTRTWEGDSIVRTSGRPAVDDYFQLPLWIQAPCCGHVLWAYNWSHLALIERYVAAGHRERRRGDTGWHNRALTSRLPRWIKSAGHRDDVLACIAKLRGQRGGL